MRYKTTEKPISRDIIRIEGVLYGVREVNESEMKIKNMKTREESSVRLPVEGLEIAWRIKEGDEGLLHPRSIQSMNGVGAHLTVTEEVFLEERNLFFKVTQVYGESICLRLSTGNEWWMPVDCLIPWSLKGREPAFPEVLDED